jgi:hypothetical protein
MWERGSSRRRRNPPASPMPFPGQSDAACSLYALDSTFFLRTRFFRAVQERTSADARYCGGLQHHPTHKLATSAQRSNTSRVGHPDAPGSRSEGRRDPPQPGSSDEGTARGVPPPGSSLSLVRNPSAQGGRGASDRHPPHHAVGLRLGHRSTARIDPSTSQERRLLTPAAMRSLLMAH